MADYTAIVKIVAYMECTILDAPNFRTAVERAIDIAESARIPPMGGDMCKEDIEVIEVREGD